MKLPTVDLTAANRITTITKRRHKTHVNVVQLKHILTTKHEDKCALNERFRI